MKYHISLVIPKQCDKILHKTRQRDHQSRHKKRCTVKAIHFNYNFSIGIRKILSEKERGKIDAYLECGKSVPEIIK